MNDNQDNSKPTDTSPDPTIKDILDYPIRRDGTLVTRRGDLTRKKPSLQAPPPGQPGSIDWTMTMMFGSTERAIRMIESLVAGQGENADEKWVRVVLLYKQWQIQHDKGEILEFPTLNQVCHALDFDASLFIRELQEGVMGVMKGLAHVKAALAVPEVIDNLTNKAIDPEADVKTMELALRLGGVIDDRPGFNLQINNTNQQAVTLKGDKERQKAPLLQFHDTVIDIDNEVRKDPECIQEGS